MVEGRIQVPTDIGASQVDETDVAILTALQEDGRRPFTEIARALGLSEGTVRQRVARLQRLGIVQIVGVVNPSRLGMRRLVIGVQVRNVDIVPAPGGKFLKLKTLERRPVVPRPDECAVGNPWIAENTCPRSARETHSRRSEPLEFHLSPVTAPGLSRSLLGAR